jgi:hypothetical protein
MKSFFHTIQTVSIATAIAVALPVLSVAENSPDDLIVVVRSAKTVEQVLTEELQSTKFARQIAEFNDIASTTTVLPIGTALSIPKPYLDSLDFGRIAYVKGDVTHKQTNLVVNPPSKGSRVFDGDVIQTGADGFVSLSFKSGVRVHVQPESRVVISNIECINDDSNCTIALMATEGQVGSEVTPRPDGKPPVEFSIETPFLTAAVRGTAFYVDLDDSANRIGVTKGLVATATDNGSNDLPKGKGMSVAEGVAPELVDLLNPPALSVTGERILLSEQDDIRWQLLDGATNYRADIAADEAMAQQLISLTTEALSFDTPSLAPGDYFLSVAGIDEKAFLGLPVKTKVAVAEIEAGQAPQLTMTRQDGVTSVSVPDYDGPLELLIGNTVNDANTTSRIMENGSVALSLTLDPASDWVFRARKILGSHKVSAYSEYYVFEANSR